MLPSNYDGQSVLYTDPVGVEHSGVVVGMSDDEQWLLIQSDVIDDDANWHFRIRVDAIGAYLVTT